MLSRVREIGAILLAPTFFFLYMIWSRPPYLRPTLVLTLAVYVFAHFIFWPPALSAEFVGRKRQLSMAKVVALNFVLSASFAAICIAVTAILKPDPAYSWRSGVRDTLDLAIANTLGFILYRFISARKPRIDILRRA